MKMLERNRGRVGCAGCGRTDGLIQQAGGAGSLHPYLNGTGLGAENAGIKIEVISLAGSGGKDLGNRSAFGRKSSGVSGAAGGAFGRFANAAGRGGYCPRGNGIGGGVGAGFEVAVGD